MLHAGCSYTGALGCCRARAVVVLEACVWYSTPHQEAPSLRILGNADTELGLSQQPKLDEIMILVAVD